MQYNIKNLEEKRKEIIKKTEECELQKQVIKRTAQKLVLEYNIGEINFYEYQRKYKKLFKDKSPEQWINHYNIQLKTYNTQIEWYEKQIKNLTKTPKLEENKQSLVERINIAKKYKKEVEDTVQKLTARFSNREINYQEYQQSIKNKFGEKTPQQWVDYYDSYIKKGQGSLTTLNQQAKKTKIKKLSLLSLPIVLGLSVLIYFLFGFISQIAITGLTIQVVDEVHTEELDIILNKSSTHIFELPYQGTLNWAKLSGEIKGKGNVKIYLDDFLILDSDNLESKTKTITGSTITGLAAEEGDDSSSDSEDSYDDSSEDSGSSESDEGSSDESSDSDTGDSSDESDTEQTSDEEESEETSGEDEQPEEPPEEEPEEPSEEPSQPSQPDEEETPENVTETDEDKKPKNETKQEKPKDDDKTDKPKEKDVKTFSDFCDQTCDLSQFNLIKSSYTLKIEIINAELTLNKLKYEISVEKEIPEGEVPENITEIPEENITEKITTLPSLIKNIPNIIIEKNSFYDIHISEYFENAEDYYLLQTPNLSFTAFDHTIRISPEENFTGTRTSRIVVTNEFGNVGGNFFNITVAEKTIDSPPVLIAEIPDMIIKTDTYIDIHISDYIENAEDYYLLQTPNLSFTAFDHTIRISPEENFTGTRTS
ncbi:MAG: hypothetical protein KKD94_03550, partial [Nanoarchaeota archaeon]|nr:hypothetical protein [Nanoarchaeota archaeon]